MRSHTYTHTHELPARLTTIYVAALCMRSGVFRCCVRLQGVTIRCKRGRIIPITRRAQSSQPPAVWDFIFIFLFFIFFLFFFNLFKKIKNTPLTYRRVSRIYFKSPPEKKSTFVIIIILLFPPFISWVWFDRLPFYTRKGCGIVVERDSGSQIQAQITFIQV